MMTVSAVAKFIPNPPALVDRRKQNAAEPGAKHIRTSSSLLISLYNYYVTVQCLLA